MAPMCSTPVGIKDRFTAERGRGSDNEHVLNACRHQRSVHSCLPMGLLQLSRAQRLSASKIGSPPASEVIVWPILNMPPFKHEPVRGENRDLMRLHCCANIP